MISRVCSHGHRLRYSFTAHYWRQRGREIRRDNQRQYLSIDQLTTISSLLRQPTGEFMLLTQNKLIIHFMPGSHLANTIGQQRMLGSVHIVPVDQPFFECYCPNVLVKCIPGIKLNWNALITTKEIRDIGKVLFQSLLTYTGSLIFFFICSIQFRVSFYYKIKTTYLFILIFQIAFNMTSKS